MMASLRSELRQLTGPELIAFATLVAGPIRIFGVVPMPGLVSVAFAAPAAYLAYIFLRTPAARLPASVLAFLGLITVSVLWSDVAAYTVVSLRTFLPVVLAVTLACCLLNSRQLLAGLRVSLGLTMALSLLALASNFAGGRPSNAIWWAQFDKNTYGGLLVLTLLLILTSEMRHRWLAALSIVVLVYLNRSVTAWAIALVLVVVVPLTRQLLQMFSRRLAIELAALATVSGTGAVLLVLPVVQGPVLDAVGKDPGLSLRTQIWAAVGPFIESNIWLGHGAFVFLNAFSNSPVTQAVWLEFTQYLPPHSHNGLLDLLGQVGLVGAAVFLVVVVRGISDGSLAALRGSREGLVGALGLVIVLALGFTEPTYLSKWLIFTVIFCALGRAASGDTAVEEVREIPARTGSQA